MFEAISQDWDESLHLVVGHDPGQRDLFDRLGAAGASTLWCDSADSLSGLIEPLAARAPQGGFQSLQLYSAMAAPAGSISGGPISASPTCPTRPKHWRAWGH